MKTSTQYPRANSAGFTLIEMIGVLAVIAILASLLIPKIFEAIDNARVNNATITCSTIKAAVADHYSKFGGLAVDGTVSPPIALTPIPNPDYDQLLLSEGFLDKRFAVRIGDGNPTNTIVQLSTAISGTAPSAANSAYDLDDDTATGDTGNDAVGTHVVEALISGVELKDAKALNDRIDGIALGEALGTADAVGRVKYGPGTVGTLQSVRVYITHR